MKTCEITKTDKPIPGQTVFRRAVRGFPIRNGDWEKSDDWVPIGTVTEVEGKLCHLKYEDGQTDLLIWTDNKLHCWGEATGTIDSE